MSISREPARGDDLPGGPVRARRAGPFRPALYVLGLLLTGAGLCSAVFCGLAFHEWHDQWGKVRSVEAVLRTGPSGVTIDGQAVSLMQAQEYARQWRAQALEKEVAAYKLLALSIGLVLGGLVVCLVGWGLRPSGEAV
jgi:hypothetical protein